MDRSTKPMNKDKDANIPMTAHFIGGCAIGDSPDTGVIDPYHRVYGHPGLHIADGSTISATLGVNPSLTITAQAYDAAQEYGIPGSPPQDEIVPRRRRLLSMRIAGGRGFAHASHRLPALLGGDAILLGEGKQAFARKFGVRPANSIAGIGQVRATPGLVRCLCRYGQQQDDWQRDQFLHQLSGSFF